MKTPKEEAKELLVIFGKELALIAVEKILYSVKDNFIYSIKFHDKWNEVLTEIENYEN
jgi:hypothetical protein